MLVRVGQSSFPRNGPSADDHSLAEYNRFAPILLVGPLLDAYDFEVLRMKYSNTTPLSTVLLALLLLGSLPLVVSCGDDDDDTTQDEVADDPITPTYGVNDFAYEGMGFDDVLALGLTGSGVDVCVIDSGIDDDHPAFAHIVQRGRLKWNDLTATAPSSDPIDTNGHGTHVAGIIAMNDVLTGGAPNVTLLIARVFTADGSTDNATIARAVDWCRTERADVISMSLGGLTLPAIQALLQQDATVSEEAVDRALDAGIYVVAAAGNDEVTRDVATPANVEGVIAVGALDTDLDTKASFSQSGLNDGLVIPAREDPNRKPEVTAPGVSITAAMAPGSTIANSQPGCQLVEYCALNGTSQATPFVTAALALVLQAVPELQPERSSAASPRDNILLVKQALSETSDKLTGQDEPHDDGLGYGRVNVPALLEALQTPSD